MHIIICGAGRVGLGLVDRLASDRADIVVIDPDGRSHKRAMARDVLPVRDHAHRRSALQQANLKDGSIIVAATPNDAINIQICSLARDLASMNGWSVRTIARLDEGDNLGEMRSGRLSIWGGVDSSVHPTEESVRRLVDGFSSKLGGEEIKRFDSEAMLLTLSIDDAHALIGCMPQQLEAIHYLGRLVKGQSKIIVEPERPIASGDLLLMGTKDEEGARYLRSFHAGSDAVDRSLRVCVLGANQQGVRISTQALDLDAKVTLVEPDLDRINRISGSRLARKEGFELIHGDHHDAGLLDEIDFRGMDVVIGSMDTDHASIAAALHALDLGIERTGVILNQEDLSGVARRMGISHVIDHVDVAVDGIMSNIGSLRDLDVTTFRRLPGYDVLTLTIPDRAVANEGVLFSELGLPHCIPVFHRGPRSAPPMFLTSNTMVRAGSTIMIIAEHEASKHIEQKVLQWKDAVGDGAEQA